MKIQKITSQHRRDFWATLICEHCEAIETNVSGYDDSYFHNNVIPNMVCKECEEKSPQDYKPATPKYDPNQII